jgi:DDE_Tnp_1-associated
VVSQQRVKCPACPQVAGEARAERWKYSRSPSPATRNTRPPMTSSSIPAARSLYLLDLRAQVPDPRRRRGRRHPLAGLLAVGVAAVFAGSRSVQAGAVRQRWADEAEDDTQDVLGAARGDSSPRSLQGA